MRSNRLRRREICPFALFFLGERGFGLIYSLRPSSQGKIPKTICPKIFHPLGTFVFNLALVVHQCLHAKADPLLFHRGKPLH